MQIIAGGLTHEVEGSFFEDVTNAIKQPAHSPDDAVLFRYTCWSKDHPIPHRWTVPDPDVKACPICNSMHTITATARPMTRNQMIDYIEHGEGYR